METKPIVKGESTCEEVNQNWFINNDDQDDLRVPRVLFWSVDDVSNLMKDIGLPQYMNAMHVNNISGRRLILLEASNLVKMGIRDFEHIKKITASARQLLTIEDPDYSRRIYLPPRSDIGMYLERKYQTGRRNDKQSYTMFLDETEGKIWEPPLTNEGLVSGYGGVGCGTMYPI